MDFVYFELIYEWLERKISTFGAGLLQQSTIFVTGVILVLVTLWVLVQGFRIVTGRSRDSMMAMVTDMSRIGVIVALAHAMAIGSVDLHRLLGEELARGINGLVTSSDDLPIKAIDRNLAYTQLAMGAIESVPLPSNDVANSSAQQRASLIAMLGVAGPPMTAGAMLLMFQVAMALFIGLGPIFILCLIFEQTKAMFHRWLMYGLGTLFSMAVLNLMVSIVMELTFNVAKALWASTVVNTITGAQAEGFSNQAMQQGGVGLLMTVLLVSTPPMAAAFFGGTLGSFNPYSAFDRMAGNRPGLEGRALGGVGASPTAPDDGGWRQAASTGPRPGIGGNRSPGPQPSSDTIKTSR
ncbi:MAG: type IV secretion system protein [Proteobacteria bacterium]|nr:type IV secretion system protein [Pseudomonadota bacterium]